ncbi:signal recognition particle subunit SRP19/SEC65 family protein [Vulcanisaeta moutnovskia]|uniref:signal recognition particle subunit SRP19/SEC65 family protein n=1 Tax=Vulcanisaeta moutnovskia TaxID=985052 RepID=UPI00064E9DAD|nr:signal recognition particle subunit SRP19/SEC65 family protein [Vulcanisaeta moutnovskia]
MDKSDYWIIWTVYFDSSRSRGFGRRVPSSMAVRSPTIEELVKAVSNLGLEFEVYGDKKHPSNWFDGPYGYIAVRKDSIIKRFGSMNKRRLLMLIAKEIIRIRQTTVQLKGV